MYKKSSNLPFWLRRYQYQVSIGTYICTYVLRKVIKTLPTQVLHLLQVSTILLCTYFKIRNDLPGYLDHPLGTYLLHLYTYLLIHVLTVGIPINQVGTYITRYNQWVGHDLQEKKTQNTKLETRFSSCKTFKKKKKNTIHVVIFSFH